MDTTNSTARFYMEYQRVKGWFIYDRAFQNEFGERWCEYGFLNSEADARQLLTDLNAEHRVEFLPGGDAGMFPAANPATMLVTIPAMDNHGDYTLHNKITVRLNKCCPICGAARGDVRHGAISYDGSRRLYDVDTWQPGCNHFRFYGGAREEAYLMLNPGYHYQADYDVRRAEREQLDAEYSTWADSLPAAEPEQPAAPTADAEIAALVDCLRKYTAAAAQIEEQKSALKERLATLLADVGGKWQDDAGYARLTPAGTRISYDTDELDNLIILEPDKYQWLRDLRTQTTVKPYVQVR